MSFQENGASFKPLSLGNVIGIPCAWTGDGISDFDGYEKRKLYAYGKLTDTLQSAIPLWVPSFRKDQTNFPDKAFLLHGGMIVNYVGIRLPEYGTFYEGVGAPYGMLPSGCTIIGTTGERLKVSPTTGTTYTVATPNIQAANNAYSADGYAYVARLPGQGDQASPSLITTIAANTPMQLTVSDAGNTVAGNGIRLSTPKTTAWIMVEFHVMSPKAPLRLKELNLPFEGTV